MKALPNNGITRDTAINKKQIVVVEAGIGESFGIVHSFVESDDGISIVLPEILKI